MELAIGFGTLLVTVAGFGLALVMLVRSMRPEGNREAGSEADGENGGRGGERERRAILSPHGPGTGRGSAAGGASEAHKDQGLEVPGALIIVWLVARAIAAIAIGVRRG